MPITYPATIVLWNVSSFWRVYFMGYEMVWKLGELDVSCSPKKPPKLIENPEIPHQTANKSFCDKSKLVCTVLNSQKYAVIKRRRKGLYLNDNPDYVT